MKNTEIIEIIERRFPLYTQESYDNSGLILEGGFETSGVYCALDLTVEVVDAAYKNGCNMIVVHHPSIFRPVKCLTENKNAALIKAASHCMTVYAGHTTVDIGVGGINDKLVELFKINNAESLTDNGIGRIGEIESTTLENLAGEVSVKLNDTHVKTVGDLNKRITRVAICGGGGSGEDMIDCAVKKGADVYITGDVKHHEALYAKNVNLAMIVFGHFESEIVFNELMVEYIDKNTNGRIKVVADKVQTSPFNKETV